MDTHHSTCCTHQVVAPSDLALSKREFFPHHSTLRGQTIPWGIGASSDFFIVYLGDSQ
jgi:hypothetical protein